MYLTSAWKKQTAYLVHISLPRPIDLQGDILDIRTGPQEWSCGSVAVIKSKEIIYLVLLYFEGLVHPIEKII